jgi:hypothetical protein
MAFFFELTERVSAGKVGVRLQSPYEAWSRA